MAMVVTVLAVEVPVFSNRDPTTTIPPAEDPLAVEVTSDALGFAPEPTASLVVMVTLPHVPVRPHASPFALAVAPEGTLTVQMDADSLVTTPDPLCFAMEAVIVLVLAVQVPI